MSAAATLAPRPRLDGTEPCRRPGVDPDLFFPAYENEAAREAAAVYCRVCPRITECLAWALEAGESGIWAATTTRQRNRMRKQHGISTRIAPLSPQEIATMTTALKPSPAAYTPGTPDAVEAELARQADAEPLTETVTAAPASATGAIKVSVQAKADLAPLADRAAAHRHGSAGAEPPSVAELIAAARATGDAKLTAQADKTEAAIAALMTMFREHQALAHAEAEVERLSARLADAKAKVRSIKQGKPAPKAQVAEAMTAARRSYDPKAVRAWAAANNVACNPHGRVQGSVVDAYLAATARIDAEGGRA